MIANNLAPAAHARQRLRFRGHMVKNIQTRVNANNAAYAGELRAHALLVNGRLR
jgi:hypothetical protein